MQKRKIHVKRSNMQKAQQIIKEIKPKQPTAAQLIKAKIDSQKVKRIDSYFKGKTVYKITPEVESMLLVAYEFGCSDLQALSFIAKNGFNCASSTFYKFLNENPEFRQRRDRAKQNPSLVAKVTLLTGLGTDAKLALDYLKSKGDSEFKDNSGVNVNVNFNNNNNKDELLELHKKIEMLTN